MTGKKHKPSWALGKGLSRKSKGLPRTPEGYPIIRDHIHKLQSELTNTEFRDWQNILAQRDELRKEGEEEKLETFEGTLDQLEEEAKSYWGEVGQRRLTPLQKKVHRRVWEERKTHEQTAKELGISKGSVEAILKQIDNKYCKLITRKFREYLKKNHPAKGSLDNK